VKRVVLFFVIGTALVFFLSIVGFFCMFADAMSGKPVNTDSIQKVRLKEIDRIKSLPELKAVIIDEDTSFSPIKGTPTAISLVKVGIIYQLSNGSNSSNRRRASKSYRYKYKTYYRKHYSGFQKQYIYVMVNNLKYKLSLDSLYVAPIAYNATEKDGLGFMEEEFKTNYDFNTTFMARYRFKYDKRMLPEEKEYFRKHKIFMAMSERFPEMKGYALYWKDRRAYYNQGEPEWQYGFTLMTYNLKKGDTLIFKGILKGERIINLF